MAIPEITVDELADLMISDVRLVDVRQPDEFAEAHVPGAILLPLAEVPDRLDEFPVDATTYVICRSGARSMRACEYAAAQGREVVNIAGGTMAWLLSGREHATGAP
jgi:rhodanese-related sulfurtransferase